MKIKNNQNHHKHRSIHQRIEYFSRHRLMLVTIMALMILALASIDSHLRTVMRDAYAEGFAWVGTYMHHEHPAHAHNAVATARIPTIAGPG